MNRSESPSVPNQPPCSRDVHVILNVATSLDGFIDDASDNRLMLSNQQDWEAVDELRAWSDAILVGANTIRKDNSRLLVRSNRLIEARKSGNRTAQPAKVTITHSGDLDPTSNFFTMGQAARVVFCNRTVENELRTKLMGLAEVIPFEDQRIDCQAMLAELASRKIFRLLVEGGSSILTQFLTAGLANALRIAIAPFFVADANATRFVLPTPTLYDHQHPMRLVKTETLDQVAVLHYELQRRDTKHD